jgi:heme a synthase
MATSQQRCARQPRRHSVVFWLAVVTLLGLFFVNVMGFLDTFTGSALGCGREWPLCNGQLVPHAWAIQTLIEFSHRGVVGVVTILLLVLAVLAWRRYGRYTEVKVAILVSVFFVVVEAILGALGVLFPDPPAILASHFGIALLAWAGALWLVVLIGQIEARLFELGERRLPTGSLPALRSPVSRSWMRGFSWFTLFYTVGALYFGAYVASTGAGGVFQGWPLPTESAAQAHGMLWLDWGHRSIAFGLVVLLTASFIQSIRTRRLRPDLFGAATIALILVVCQAFTGAWLVVSHLDIQAFMAHVSNVTLLFGTVSLVGLQTLPERDRQVIGLESTSQIVQSQSKSSQSPRKGA